ncbi:MAG TPA: SNF2-related protein [Gemmatimonadaceae bacterium]|nr:SNF2-related protein [Gemmatimonadaceae bacterium]
MDPRADAVSARAAIARAWLGLDSDGPAPSISLGNVTLRPHQAAGVARLRAAIDQYGGALLADETGLGKTYIAVALLAEAKQPLVVAPSALLPMWRRVLTEASVSARIHSCEALSHGRRPAPSDFVVVDEAHHFRNPATRRYAALAELTTRARVLLLSATPVHNAHADITALLALFRANPPLGRVIVRREHSAETRPRVLPMQWIATIDDEATLHDILALPAPVPPRDGDVGGALVAHGLVRQWASSAGALTAALRRRLGRAIAMAAAFKHDRHPTYYDLRSWCLGEGAVQLAFPELLIPEITAETCELREAVEAHAHGVRRLLAQISARPNPDLARAAALKEIATGRKTIAFSAYEDTVHAIARHHGYRRTCALGGRGGIVAGGRLRRAEAIARFAPIAMGCPAPAAAHAIDVLIATDFLSEGLNLQDASVVVHLDLPWTPARMEQRVGRAARVGSPHPCVSVYALAPPASAEVMLGVERRLQEKLQQAARTVGVSLMLFPQPRATSLRSTLERWAAADVPSGCIGSVHAERSGFLAAVRVDAETLLVADLGSGITDDPDDLLRAIGLAEHEATVTDGGERETAERAVLAWGERRGATRDIHDLGSRHVARRIAGIVSKAHAHRRPMLAEMAARARRAATLPLGVGAVRALGALAEAEMDDEAWLAAIAAFADDHGRTRPPPRPGVEILAMLLFHQ